MLSKTDKILKVYLFSPHNCAYVCEREDGTHYAFCKNKDSKYYNIHKENDRWIFDEQIDVPD